MKFKTFILLICIVYVVICSRLININDIEKIDKMDLNLNNKIPFYDFYRKLNFIQIKELENLDKPHLNNKFFKGSIRTDKYKMNQEDNLTYSKTNDIIQKKFYFDVDINMNKEIISGFLRIFYQCKKSTKYFILDFKSLKIFKILDNKKNNLNFYYIKNTNISKALGKGLKIEFKKDCKVEDENYSENNFVDIYYSTTKKSVALHFSHRTMLENKKYGFMYSHGAAIFARTLFPCQDSPFAKVKVEGKLRIENPYTVLFAGEIKNKRDIFINENKSNNNKILKDEDKILIQQLNELKRKNIETIQINKQTPFKLNSHTKNSFIETFIKLKNSNDSIKPDNMEKLIKNQKKETLDEKTNNILNKSDNNLNSVKKGIEYHFILDKPISPYLITFAAGYLEKRDFGEECIVYGEPKILHSKKTSASFFDCSEFVEFYDKNIYRNVWGKMKFLIIPDDFPYGGMENPYNIHVSKSVLTDDGSLRNVIAHEIAHFWSGNLVTNYNWEHFWLNEGFTNYLYRKCYQKLFGKEEFMKELDKSQKRLKSFLRKEAYLEKMRNQRNKKLKIQNKGKINKIEKIKNQIQKISMKINIKNKNDNDDDNDNFNVKNKDKTHLSLWPKIRGTDPYNNFSLIPYEKGFSFLYFLETKFGEKFVFGLLRDYFSKFKFSAAKTNDFIDLLKSHISKNKNLKGKEKERTLQEININEWIHGVKEIPAKFNIKSEILEKIKNFEKKVLNFKMKKEEIFNKLMKYNTYYRNYVLFMIDRLYMKIPKEKINKYEKILNYIIEKFFELENKGLLEDSTKSKLILMKGSLIEDKTKKKEYLVNSLDEFKYYHISYLKNILSMLKFECDLKNPEIITIINKIKSRFNKLTVLRLMQFLFRR